VRLRGRLDYLLDDITESQPLALILGHLEQIRSDILTLEAEPAEPVHPERSRFTWLSIHWDTLVRLPRHPKRQSGCQLHKPLSDRGLTDGTIECGAAGARFALNSLHIPGPLGSGKV
jgi:hypothetical protein